MVSVDSDLKCNVMYGFDVCFVIVGVWVIRRLQADMKFSAAGESFNMRYVWQSLRDWKTWIASELIGFYYSTGFNCSWGSGYIHGIVSKVPVHTTYLGYTYFIDSHSDV